MLFRSWLPEWASQRFPFLLSRPSPRPPAGPCSALQGAEDPRPSHLPGTGVLCTLLDSGRRSLSPGPRRYPHSCTGSGSRGRGLQGHRGSLSPTTVSSPKASGLQGSVPSLAPAPAPVPPWSGHPCPPGLSSCLRPGPLASAPLTYLAVPSREAWGTVALVFADVVEAGAAVVTGARGA